MQNPNITLDAFANFIEPRLGDVPALNASYYNVEGYQIVNGTKTGVNFSMVMRKFYDNYTVYTTNSVRNTRSVILTLNGTLRGGFICSQSPLAFTLPNGTSIGKGEFVCSGREGLVGAAEDAVYYPFVDTIGLSGANTTSTGFMSNITVISGNVSYAGDICTLTRSEYVVVTSYPLMGVGTARYQTRGNLTQCMSNKYYAVLFSRFVGTSNDTLPEFANGTVSMVDLTNVYTFYQTNASSINGNVNPDEFKFLPGPIAQPPT
ncbi:MAG: hypothetical protein KGH58_02220 [Candidatus Micrarchaeota archaeon]|nr:hypothetical protein [Candidatus Micrarchaeota archaeon]